MKNSLDYLNLVVERGFVTQPGCSTVTWAHAVADKNNEEFIQLLREKSNLTLIEMTFLINRLHDVFPTDIVESWMKKVVADPDAAMILGVYALRWKDYRKKMFFKEFIKTFADNPHYHLAQIMFSAGAL